MSLAWHVVVKVVFALQVTNFPLIKFSSTHKVLTSLTPSQISEAQAVTSKNFPSLPPSSPTRCRVGWSDSVPVAFAHVLLPPFCYFVLFPMCGKIRKTREKGLSCLFNLFETRMSVRTQSFYFYREKSWRGNWKLSFALHWLPSASIHASSSFHHACLR